MPAISFLMRFRSCSPPDTGRGRVDGRRRGERTGRCRPHPSLASAPLRLTSAPTSKWCSPAAPVRHPASGASARPSPTRCGPNRSASAPGTYAVNYPATYDFLGTADGAADATAHIAPWRRRAPTPGSCSAATRRARRWSTSPADLRSRHRARIPRRRSRRSPKRRGRRRVRQPGRRSSETR